ncbi:MAG: FAD-dependent thymidylate synthase [Candidatus Gracilibacteria bacterium]|nr:FAD-dependent thymidylate synthase [Candidatus Gracilibacteria bacterium]
MDLSDLKHIELYTNSGARIFILNKGEVIDSENEAMLQALHSRSIGGIKSHLKVLEEKGSDKFMSSFYVGYGHKSIGDCGSITIFIEGVSMLAAKAIQDSKLYNGQEASTRYIDFSEQEMINVAGVDLGNEILEKQRKFYLNILEPIELNLKNTFPLGEGEKEAIYDKAIKAKAFDIARGFLPAGTSTNLAWHSNLRQVADRLMYLRNHPLQEVREIASVLEEAVILKYPNSFSTKRYEDTENYINSISSNYYYHNVDTEEFNIISDNIDENELKKNISIYNSRPNSKTELPVWLNNDGIFKIEFLLDFGSFRDLQRHRAINQRMPLLTDELGFNKWYFSQLPNNILEKSKVHLDEIKKMIDSLNLSKEDKQYYLPMGYNISNQISGTLPSMVYMAELRSTQYVHPTLRVIAQKIGKYLEEKYAFKLFVEKSEYDFDINRGKHDIVLK